MSSIIRLGIIVTAATIAEIIANVLKRSYNLTGTFHDSYSCPYFILTHHAIEYLVSLGLSLAKKLKRRRL